MGIEVETLDNLWKKGILGCGNGKENKQINVLKIDSEGVEKDVVEGALELITEHSPLIYAESQPYFADGDMRFVNFMRDTVGYSCSPVKGLEMHEILLCIP